jgi:hypothetical protein
VEFGIAQPSMIAHIHTKQELTTAKHPKVVVTNPH